MKRFLLPAVKGLLEHQKKRTGPFAERNGIPLPPFHNHKRVFIDLNNAGKIAKKFRQYGWKPSKRELTVAANAIALSDLMHDHPMGERNHEERSAEFAERHLKGVDPSLVKEIKRAILATKPDSKPVSTVDQIVKDSDYGELANYRRFLRNNELLAEEYGISREREDLKAYELLKKFSGNEGFASQAAKDVFQRAIKKNKQRFGDKIAWD
ncbi:MAG TPA: hypothetical protein VJI71_01865 [Candidatus Norongarragalinales archaeon]|nr:hypothetical protein [Candidatus Norongarragalinales archaeon]